MKRELIEFSPTLRIENGPARATGIATEELLDDKVTAGHYQVGEFDAVGKRIQLKKPMTYMDYYGGWVWYVYKLVKVGFNAKGQVLFPDGYPLVIRTVKPEGEEAVRAEERWLPVDIQPTKESALAAAEKLQE